MADTIQGVMWALGQKCRLRQGDDWEKPATAIKTLSDCQTYSRLRKRDGRAFGVFGDVCVTSVTPALPGDEISRYDYPQGGFVLAAQFAAAGGLPALHQLCGECPANDNEDGIAGCAGFFYLSLCSEELQKQLDRLIADLRLASKLNSLFPQTKLHWFRFWIQSPLPPDGVPLLQQLFAAVYDEEKQERAKQRSQSTQSYRCVDPHSDLNDFVKALERSRSANIPIHVNVTPPGHTDLGWHTIFSHCPRCKAEAPVKRWQRKYRTEEIECAICGASYSPAKTHSSKRDKWDRRELRDILGQAEFENLAVRCLIVQGASDSEAAEIVRKHEERECARREEGAQRIAEAERHDRFVESVIYHGLKNLNTEKEGESGWLCSAADTEQVLRRCKQHGGKVRFISHVSESGERDEFLGVSWFTPAEKAFRKLRQKGCDEKFSIFLTIPKEVVDCWKA
jgi:transposase-like protein